jgi:hypothetical protein
MFTSLFIESIFDIPNLLLGMFKNNNLTCNFFSNIQNWIFNTLQDMKLKCNNQSTKLGFKVKYI